MSSFRLMTALVGIAFLFTSALIRADPADAPVAIKLAVTGVLVIPYKHTGDAWDAGGSPWDVTTASKATEPLGPETYQLLTEGLHRNNVMSVIRERLPWAVPVLADTVGAPDISATLTVNDKAVQYLPKVQDRYLALWPSDASVEAVVASNSSIRVTFVDSDLVSNDYIGSCVVKGAPKVDSEGYISAQSIACTGQVWAVSIRIVSAIPAALSPSPAAREATARLRANNLREFTRMKMSTIESGMIQFHKEAGQMCPSSLQELVDRKILHKLPRDGWDQLFITKCPGADGRIIDLVSLGQDGKVDTEDDIRSWQ